MSRLVAPPRFFKLCMAGKLMFGKQLIFAIEAQSTVFLKRINYFSIFQKHVFIFKMGFGMWFIFEMCFHFQNVKGFVSVVFPFSEKHNCKQKSVHSLQIALLMRL